VSCLCTDDDGAECSGGGLPRFPDGECSCGCHAPLRRWLREEAPPAETKPDAAPLRSKAGGVP
jgi:hypothetical protein